MDISAPSDLFAALATGGPEAILGTPESAWLDFKGAPYRLDKHDEKLELAKDVTALANSVGGVLVVGYETRREEATAREIANRVLPVRADLVSFTRYQDVVEQWTFPPIRGLNLRWWPCNADPRVFSIEVPAAGDSAPVLVSRVKEHGSRRELLFGVFQRSGDRVSRITVGEVHTWIQLGRSEQRAGALPATAQPVPPAGPSDKQRAERLDQDTRDAGLGGQRRYFLQAWPVAKAEVQELHKRDATGLRSILSRPPELRWGGFSLGTAMQPSLLPGGGLRVLDEQQQSLSLERHGLLTLVVTAGSEFLAWADGGRGKKHSINPLALMECTLEFVRLFKLEVLPRCAPPVNAWRLAGGMRDLKQDNEPSTLAPGPVKRHPFRDEFQAAAGNHFDVGPMEFRGETPGSVAFTVVREVYVQFGIDESHIPYVENGEVSEQLIRQTR